MVKSIEISLFTYIINVINHPFLFPTFVCPHVLSVHMFCLSTCYIVLGRLKVIQSKPPGYTFQGGSGGGRGRGGGGGGRGGGG